MVMVMETGMGMGMGTKTLLKEGGQTQLRVQLDLEAFSTFVSTKE